MKYFDTVASCKRLSGFHKTIVTVMKIIFKKHSSIREHLEGYKYFDQNRLKIDLREN